MKYFKYSELEGQEGIDACGICIDEFANGDERKDEMMVAQTPCNHYFHKGCLLEWIKTKIDKLEKPDCPQCRTFFEPKKQTDGPNLFEENIE